MTINLEPFSKSDVQYVYDVEYGNLADRTWMAFNGPYFQDPIPTWPEFQQHADGLIDHAHHRLIWYNQRIVGEVSAHWADGPLQRWLEIGIVIYQKSDWGKGIATASVKIWIAELFSQHTELPHIGLTTWSGNTGMMRASEKIGLLHEGTIRQVRYWQGTYYDSVKYGILRTELA
ncbi:GNAT family N-acetyltransferase [Leuconostoc inhae]|uniref:GNAT family N-acetyltransferase n=1 Tax=Leuconostoc inhae TaxID=178001 RepID=UPI001C7D8690|nr:GNAT family protein [Leuconostoc inhae]